jgi:hypothetical protein
VPNAKSLKLLNQQSQSKMPSDMRGPVAADPQGDSYVQQLACEEDRPFSRYLLNRAGRDFAAADEQKPERPLRFQDKSHPLTFPNGMWLCRGRCGKLGATSSLRVAQGPNQGGRLW